MNTIEERALDAAREAMLRWYESRTTVNGLITSVNKPDYIDGYVDGATEQRKIDIDNACEWLRNNWRDYLFRDKDGMSCFAHWENDFRKAMEG